MARDVSSAFDKAVIEVFNMMAGVSTEKVDKVEQGDNKIITGCMVINISNYSGLIKISVQETTAKRIVSSMTGMPEDTLGDELILDGVGEILNMTAGLAKSYLVETENYFHLSPPFIVHGDDYKFTFKTGTYIESNYYVVQGESFSVDILHD